MDKPYTIKLFVPDGNPDHCKMDSSNFENPRSFKYLFIAVVAIVSEVIVVKFVK